MAICDYVVSKRIKEHSRHLYDLHKIYPNINFDDEMNLLFKTIIKKRNDKKIGHQYDVQMKIYEQFENIINNDIYKEDYEEVTKRICIKQIEYEDVIKSIIRIKDDLQKYDI